jgi:hypothetical protein
VAFEAERNAPEWSLKSQKSPPLLAGFAGIE